MDIEVRVLPVFISAVYAIVTFLGSDLFWVVVSVLLFFCALWVADALKYMRIRYSYSLLAIVFLVLALVGLPINNLFEKGNPAATIPQMTFAVSVVFFIVFTFAATFYWMLHYSIDKR